MVIALLAFTAFRQSNLIKSHKSEKKQELSARKSREVIFGQSAEKIAPFLDSFGFDPQKSQFLGQPIDYIVFDEQEICFVEIKTGKARLTKKQRDIKQLIEDKKVSWKEVRI